MNRFYWAFKDWHTRQKSVADYCRCYSNEGQCQTNVSENVQHPFICLYRINEQRKSFNAKN